MARIVSEMNQPVPDPTTLIRPQATPESSIVSETEDEDDDDDMLGEYHSCFVEPGREIAPNTGANATKFFTLATKS